MSKQKVRNDEPGMGFDTEAEEPESIETGQPTASELPRPRQTDRPFCPVHNVQMVAYWTDSMFTHYGCPLKKERKCSETAKRVRPVGPLKDLYGNGKSRRE